MIVHLLSRGPISQVSGGYLYNRSVLNHLRVAGYSTRYHGNSENLGAIAGEDCIVADGLVLNEFVDYLIASPCRIVLLLHTFPDSFGRSRTPSAFVPENLSDLFSKSLVVVTGSRTCDGLRQALPHAGPRMVCIEPGVSSSWTCKKHYSATAQSLLCVANYIAGKGHIALLHALSDIRDLNWRLDIFGNRQFQPQRYAETVQQVGSLDLADKVCCHGTVSHKEINRRMLEADLLVHLSQSESFSLVVAEAIASGLPVFAYRTGNAEAFCASGLVQYVDDLDTRCTSTRIRSLMEDPQAYARMRRNPSWQPRLWEEVGREFAQALGDYL